MPREDLDEHDELAGRLVRLRALTVDDLDALAPFDRDSQGARQWGETGLPVSRARARATIEKWEAEPHGDTSRLTMELIETREVIGTMTVGHANARHGRFKYGIGIGLPFRGRGCGSEAITLLLRFYFTELRYQKCDTSVYAFNDGSLRLHERLGFQVEGRVRRAIYTQGQYHDEVIVGITAEEFLERHGR